jgi:hypothetical protein
MSTTEEQIAQSQRLVDLRQRMVKNVAEGKPSHEGIPPEEIRAAVEGLRSRRAVAGARGGNKKAANASAKSDPLAASSLNDRLKSLGMDLD